LAESLAMLARVCSDLPDTPVDKLAVVLPSNALGVNRAWLPALVYGASVALKPGALDPFTPHRLVAALIHGGFPAEYFSVYPSGHETTDVLISLWPRVQLFGDAEVAARYRDNPAVQVNGPGRSALVLGADVEIEEVFEEVVQGICLHEGRTCLNTTSIAFMGGEEGALDVARKLAERLDETPSVHLSERAKSEAIQGAIERALRVPGALRLTKARSAHAEEASGSLLPTLLFCQDSAHPLARMELPLPFASVSALSPEALPAWLGPTLSVATLGVSDEDLERLRSAPNIERLWPESAHSLTTSMGDLHLERMQRLLS